ncbi:MAG: RagB/SusD family nutrient uptake outer membrane protein [Gemmatimonadetes bacterium]|nr:RagB/SusD family nutrient uptake outer membrane protein [Gemmatimonadota bacterium]
MPRHSRTAGVWLTCLTALGGLTGCEGLLDVRLPGRIPVEALDAPTLANTLVESVAADFACAFTHYVTATALLADEMIHSSASISWIQWGRRQVGPDKLDYSVGTCQTTNAYGLYTPLQTARFQAEDVMRRLKAFPDADVPSKTSLIGTAAAYAGYSYLLFGEGFCAAAFDGGPLKTRKDMLDLAKAQFDVAIGATTGDVLQMARVGRARARLYGGDKIGALEDARPVPEGFRFYASRGTESTSRLNRVYVDNNRDRNISVDARFRGLTWQGVIDRRVDVRPAGRGQDGTELWVQTKYASESAPIPIATWEEAQLIMAEVEGGQRAVDMINRLHARAGLPPFVSSDPDEIAKYVRQERSRELWLDGHRLGDMLRFGLPFDSGIAHDGQPYGNTTCLPLPDVERDGNPNIP